MIKSNPAQAKTIRNILSLFRQGHRAQILGWYTGGGKTHIFLSAIEEILRSEPDARIGVSAYFLTNIKTQIAERIQSYDVISTDTIDSRKTSSGASVLIFNPQALYLNETLDVKFDYLFVDESHAGLGEGRKMLPYIRRNHCKSNCKLLAISATPWELFSLPEFKKAIIHKRGIDRGYMNDKRVAEVSLKFHEGEVKFHREDFNRSGDLKPKELMTKREVLRVAAIKKLTELKAICTRNDKVLVVAPTGLDCGIAESIALHLGDEALLLTNKTEHEEQVIEQFKQDRSIRFLVVINKCRIGYDMPELTRIINISMTKNVKRLVHDLGRISRLNPQDPTSKKTYHYIFNQAMSKAEVEALFRMVLRCAVGIYPTRSRINPLHEGVEVDDSFGEDDSEVTLKNLLGFIRMVKFGKPSGIKIFGRENDGRRAILVLEAKDVARKYQKNGYGRKYFADKENNMYRILLDTDRALLDELWPYYTKRTLEKALTEAKKYSSRRELTRKNNALYTWFRNHNRMKELNEILPQIIPWGKWNAVTSEAEARKYASRNRFKKGAPGAFGWFSTHDKDRLDKIFGKVKKPSVQRWTFEQVVELARKNGIRTHRELRGKFSGAAGFLWDQRLIDKFRQEITVPYRASRSGSAQ